MPADSSASQAVRELLETRFPDAMVRRDAQGRDAARLAGPVASGIAPLDAVLRGGFPRGQLTAWAPGGGVHTVLSATCRTLRDGGERAAWVDATGVTPFGWASGAGPVSGYGPPGSGPGVGRRRAALIDAAGGRPLLVQAPDRREAFRAAVLLLESGAFGLVVVEVPPGQEAVGKEIRRLARAAHVGGGGLVAITPVASMAPVRVTSRLLTHAAPRELRAAATGGGHAGSGRAACGDTALGIVWARDPFGAPALPVAVRARVRVQAPGWNTETTLAFGVAPIDLRSALECGVDRRGARASRSATGRVPDGAPGGR